MPKTRKRIAAVVCAVLMTSSCMNPLAVAAVDEYGASSSEAVLLSGEAASDIEINETTFPDATFRQYVIDTINGGSTTLTAETIDSVTSIDVSGTYNEPNTIADLTGIGYFSKLTYLNCDYNQLTDLDVSKNTSLASLQCYGNQLDNLDVSNNTALIDLNCGYNKLTSLNVSNNTTLKELDCYGNQLTSLDVSKNTDLTFLSISGNPDTTRGAYGKKAILRCLGRTASQNYVVLFCFLILILILNQCVEKICAKTIYAGFFLIFGRNHHKKTSVYVFYRKISDSFLNSDKKVQEQLTSNC